jgi:hypothetical protein
MEPSDEQEFWLTKLALVGVTVEEFCGYWFTYYKGRMLICGMSLEGVAKDVIGNIQMGLYT